MRFRLLHTVLFVAIGACACASGSPQSKETKPFALKGGLFDQNLPATLGLRVAPDVETATIFAPAPGEHAYNHGAVLMPFKNRLYAQWQSSKRDEDAPETYVAYSLSENFHDWAPRQTLAAPRTDAMVTSGGWWSDGDTLVAFINVWPHSKSGVRSGYTEYITSKDGRTWTAPSRVTDHSGRAIAGVIEQDPHKTSDGRLVTAFHIQPGLTASPYYTDDPLGISGWTRGEMQNLPSKGDVSRELEPSWFERRDGSLVMIFRDQASSFNTLASVSTDHAESWSTPMLVDFPDSRSKQSAGNFPNGYAYRVNNPRTDRTRSPLVVTVSTEGFLFDRAWLLRTGGADLQPLRTDGRYKRAGYSYPKSIVWGDYLYTAYAANKEDIEVTRAPWRGLLAD